MTGAPMPPGTDAVVPIEQCRVDPGAPAGEVTLPTARAGAHIRRAGEDVAAGDVVARAGSTLDPRTAGLCAATGRGAVSVHPAPRVVVVTTGSELVAAGTDAGHLSAAGVHDSTAITLVAELRARGADASHRGPVGDDPEAFLVALHEAVREADLVITSGGVSAGDRDVVKASLRQHPDFWFGPVAVRPGRPQGHGHLSVDRAEGARRVPVVTLPGTPAASYLTFLAFVVPLVDRLAGRLPDGVATDATAVLAEPVRARPDRVVLLAGRRDGDGRVRVLPGHVGHSQRLLAAAEVVLIVPAADTDLPAGARIAVIELAPGRRIAE